MEELKRELEAARLSAQCREEDFLRVLEESNSLKAQLDTLVAKFKQDEDMRRSQAANKVDCASQTPKPDVPISSPPPSQQFPQIRSPSQEQYVEDLERMLMTKDEEIGCLKKRLKDIDDGFDDQLQVLRGEIFSIGKSESETRTAKLQLEAENAALKDQVLLLELKLKRANEEIQTNKNAIEQVEQFQNALLAREEEVALILNELSEVKQELHRSQEKERQLTKALEESNTQKKRNKSSHHEEMLSPKLLAAALSPSNYSYENSRFMSSSPYPVLAGCMDDNLEASKENISTN